MRKFTLCMVAVLAFLFCAAPVYAQTTEVRSLVFNDTLTTGTSAQTIYSEIMNIRGWDYVGFNVFCDVTTGGSSGSAALSVEGRGKGQTAGWTTIWMTDFGDSLDVVSSMTLNSTSDIYKHFIITACPVELNAEGADADDTDTAIYIGNLLPFEIIRIKIVDTNWNAGAKFYGNEILKRD